MRLVTEDMSKQILKLYKLDKTVVDDDKRLLANIWTLNGWDQNKDLLTNLRNVPSPETIRRTRQKLHQEGLIEYSEEVEEERYEASKEVREEMSTYSAVDIQGSGRKATAVIKEDK